MYTNNEDIMVKLVEKIHFNKDILELQNICIVDRNRKYLISWNGVKWTRNKYNNIAFEIFDKCLTYVLNNITELKKLTNNKEIFDAKILYLKKLKDTYIYNKEYKIYEDDITNLNYTKNLKKIRNDIINKIEDVLYNGREFINKNI